MDTTSSQAEVPKKRLTERQAEVFALITDSFRNRGYGPTIREIMQRMGIKSTNGVRDHLVALERKGWINPRPAGHNRSITIVGGTPQMEPARALRPASDDTIDVFSGFPISVCARMLKPSFARDADFGIRVDNDRMTSVGFAKGDVLFIVKRMPKADELAAFRINERNVLARYSPNTDQAVIDDGLTMYIRREDMQMYMLGTVIGMYREIKQPS